MAAGVPASGGYRVRSVCFIVPAHGRVDLAAVCLRQLRRTCDVISTEGTHASAVVIACDENLDTARELGFATVERDNDFLGRRFNDGYELASRSGFTHVMPCGSDDWVDPSWILTAPVIEDTPVCPRLCAMVDETGLRMRSLSVGYEGGLGLRLTPTALLEPFAYRPVEEDRNRAIDASTSRRLKTRHPQLGFVYHDLHPFQIVDWKSQDGNLNTYAMCSAFGVGEEQDGFAAALADHFPADAVAEMVAFYANRTEELVAVG